MRVARAAQRRQQQLMRGVRARIRRHGNTRRRDGTSWETEDELYNGGSAFKICCRDHYGPIAFATYILGQEFYAEQTVSLRKVSLELALSLLGDRPSLPDRLLSS